MRTAAFRTLLGRMLAGGLVLGGLLLGGVLLLAGCSTGGDPGSGDHAGARPASRIPGPTVGGAAPVPATPPSAPMDDLEQPIAARLATRVDRQGLTLDYLDCPAWDGGAPQRMVCKGYLDGVVADVAVRLSRETGGAVSFDATLGDGVIATSNLVGKLTAQGYSDVDCGDVPAYPATVGSELVCQVAQGGRTHYVRATVTSRSGAVDITDY